MTKKQLIRRRTERKEPLWCLDPATREACWGIPHNFYADRIFEDMEFESRIPDDYFYVELLGSQSDPEALSSIQICRASEVFATKDLALRYRDVTKRAQIEAYKEELPDAKRLVAFCLDHVVAPAEQYTDDAARQAVLERGKELFGAGFLEEVEGHE